MDRIHRRLIHHGEAVPAALALALAVLLGSSTALADSHEEFRTPWDQAAVLALSEELVTSLKDLTASFRRNEQASATGARASKMRARQDLRMLGAVSRNLRSDLQEGLGYDETLPVFERLQLLRRDAAENAATVL